MMRLWLFLKDSLIIIKKYNRKMKKKSKTIKLKKYQKDNTGINKLNIHKRLEIKIN